MLCFEIYNAHTCIALLNIKVTCVIIERVICYFNPSAAEIFLLSASAITSNVYNDHTEALWDSLF